MKKTVKIAVLLCLALLLSAMTFTACDKTPDNESQTTPEATTPEATTPEVTTPEATTPEVTTPDGGEETPPAVCEHVEATRGGVAPTCMSEGATAEVYCTVCGEILEGSRTLRKISHDTTDGTCSMCGVEIYTITLWVSEKEGVAEQFKKQIQAFMNEHPDIIINAKITGVTAADAGHKVIADIYSAPDLYCFAQDHLARLVEASALMPLEQSMAAKIAAANSQGSIAAATYNNTLYAYPMTNDNGYFMYYDTSIISPEDAESLESLIAACEKNNKKFRFALENAWYNASFFFATGCYSNWVVDAEGNFIGLDDTFNSPEGLIAMRGMQMLTQSTCYDSNADIITDDTAVIITGAWNASLAEYYFGENLGATDLPSFTVDGNSYHLGSFSGHQLLGVKPQSDAKKAVVLSLLAEYLTGAECQMQRLNDFMWTPSNLEAQQSEAFQSNASAVALAKQSAYSLPQNYIHGSWWDIAKFFGERAKKAETEADLVEALETYDNGLKAVLEQLGPKGDKWSVIGNICNTMWDTDIPMSMVSEGVWETDTLSLQAGKEFKVRKNESWDINFGANGAPNGLNVVVETTGNYKVRFTYDGTTAKIELVPVN